MSADLWCGVILGLLATGMVAQGGRSMPRVDRWGCFEAVLKSARPHANPFTDAVVSTRFECDGEAITVKGFYNGEGIWKTRCMPTKEGRWTFRTQSPDPELNDPVGEFLCVPPARGNHGPVHVAHTWHFAYADGALLLPEGAPWGWVQAGDGPLADLRGLCSFTISGWLRPASLETGMGGNRIVHCLNRDTDGIDFVSHADGRLRLAVNEWPDRIKNDSSPGKLVVGKWTFFAVTCDGTRSRDNVSWYFSVPRDTPDELDVELDRRTTYNNGPVGTDLRDLAIGNFNRTMQRYGLDRQFRGEIRGLQIHGSRLGGRGTLDTGGIRNLMQ